MAGKLREEVNKKERIKIRQVGDVNSQLPVRNIIKTWIKPKGMCDFLFFSLVNIKITYLPTHLLSLNREHVEGLHRTLKPE